MDSGWDLSWSVIFDSNTLTTIPYVQFMRRYPNDLPPVNIDSYDLVRQDGQVNVAKSYGPKGVSFDVIINAPNRELYEIAFNTLKLFTRGLNADLVVTQAGHTVRYISTLQNIVHTPIEAGKATLTLVFTASYPFGIETTQTNYNESSITSIPHALAYEFDGTSTSKPVFTITLNSFTGSGSQSMTLYNTTSGQGVTITRTGWTAGNVVIVDTKHKFITVNGVLTDYTGVFPTFEPDEDVTAYSDTFSVRNVNIGLVYFREFL